MPCHTHISIGIRKIAKIHFNNDMVWISVLWCIQLRHLLWAFFFVRNYVLLKAKGNSHKFSKQKESMVLSLLHHVSNCHLKISLERFRLYLFEIQKQKSKKRQSFLYFNNFSYSFGASVVYGMSKPFIIHIK